jgi:hypothetical protein
MMMIIIIIMDTGEINRECGGGGSKMGWHLVYDHPIRQGTGL